VAKTRLALGVVLLAVLGAGCGRVGEAAFPDLSREETISVVATTGMVADAVRHVGGERVHVTGLMGPGVDPHLYKASEGDVRRLEGADVIFFNGLHLEAKMADVLERIGEQRRTAAVADTIPEPRILTPEAFEGQADPHVWFDVGLWRDAVRAVRDTLAGADPAHAALYRRNADAYLEELSRLDAYVRAQTMRVPEGQRTIVTAHDAFGYFGAAYGFEVVGLQGISTAAEAGAKDVQRLADLIAERRLPAIFVESSIAPRTIEAVQEAVRARGHDVEIGGSLFSDALGSAGTPEGEYVGMVRHNVDTIVSALVGGGEG
jgi:manganese/zinc/iron transport system substrate-binding protein